MPPAAVFCPQGVRITGGQTSCETWPDQSWISETQARVSVAEKVLDSFRPARLGIRRAGSRRFSKWIDLTHSLVKEPGDPFRCRTEARQLLFTPSRQARVSGSEKPADSSILGNANPKGTFPLVSPARAGNPSIVRGYRSELRGAKNQGVEQT